MGSSPVSPSLLNGFSYFLLFLYRAPVVTLITQLMFYIVTHSRYLVQSFQLSLLLSTPGEGLLLNGDLPSGEPSLADSTSQDVLSVASSHGSGSTPPREFVVSAFEPNNCGAEFTVSSQSSYDELRGKVCGGIHLVANVK
jgi:hypothetical protein